MTKLMDPGPANNGTPSGTMAEAAVLSGSCRFNSSSGFNIDIAVSSNTRPPPTRRDPSDVPSALRIISPATAAITSTRAAVLTAVIAVRDFSGEVSPMVSDRKGGIAANGANIANMENAKLEYSGKESISVSILFADFPGLFVIRSWFGRTGSGEE